MNKIGLMHRPKSEYAYTYDKQTLHILMRTAKNDITEVQIVYGDPFEWIETKDHGFAWVHYIEKMEKRYTTDLYDFYFIAIKPHNKRVKYAFLLNEDNQLFMYGTRLVTPIDRLDSLYRQHDLSDFFNFPYMHEQDMHQTPSWVKDTIWYQIFPDRFYGIDSKSNLDWYKRPVQNHELYGGNLKGVIAKLDYLKDLGITGIYFTPIFKSPTAHKYDTTDYYQIDEQFGTIEDLKILVSKAHQLGIKVMLDGVFNHAGYHHAFFQDVLKNQEHSIYKNCFYIKHFPIRDRHDYESFAFAKNMPKWRAEDPLAEAHLLGVIKYWIETCDIDGWRLDVSNEVSHDFLRKIKTIARQTKKEVFVLGENMDDAAPWLQGDQMDSVMNYDLTYPMWAFFENRMSLNDFKNTVLSYLARTPKHVIANMFNLVGCHDNPRIKTRLHENKNLVKLINIFMFTTAGTPNVYYGDEIGMSGYQDPDNRRTMIWDESRQDKDMLNFMKHLIQLRKEHTSFKTPDYYFLNHDILSYIKKDENEEVLVILNTTSQNKTLDISQEQQGNYIDLFSSKTFEIHDKIYIEAYGYLLLKKKG